MDKKGVQCNKKISDIVKKAGVSRMTFIIIMKAKRMRWQIFFHEIAAECERMYVPGKGKYGKFHDVEALCKHIKYFDQYAGFIFSWFMRSLYYIVIDAMNEYMMNRFCRIYKISDYELYFYGGALLNVSLCGGERKTGICRGDCPDDCRVVWRILRETGAAVNRI